MTLQFNVFIEFLNVQMSERALCLLVFGLSYYIKFYYYLLEVYFLMRDRKVVDPDVRDLGRTGRSRGKEAVITINYVRKKIYFQ